ncbi:hypothetical protein K505DRAFT_324910 [Melanomma pulvis-pyrius CBS 109.77]|uniref:Uncharacterized protein n=1 Tax=Melanomma pulvis-pyrius CBS 109.77 TaxID=1314802 RepID=A0A6A6XD48_9PLEO|nr:hypothetical protein K505DRAFT_324910 [Melanomma pulvis-pyrius CBS 109.77]
MIHWQRARVLPLSYNANASHWLLLGAMTRVAGRSMPPGPDACSRSSGRKANIVTWACKESCQLEMHHDKSNNGKIRYGVNTRGNLYYSCTYADGRQLYYYANSDGSCFMKSVDEKSYLCKERLRYLISGRRSSGG